eukprot:scaffold880_cov384-Prasinococcus_capsulatus_cf.AAC.7
MRRRTYLDSVEGHLLVVNGVLDGLDSIGTEVAGLAVLTGMNPSSVGVVGSTMLRTERMPASAPATINLCVTGSYACATERN